MLQHTERRNRFMRKSLPEALLAPQEAEILSWV